MRDLKEQLEQKRKLCKEFSIGNEFVAKKPRKPVKIDKHWLMGQHFEEEEDNEWSEDEDE